RSAGCCNTAAFPDIYVQHVLASGTVDPDWPNDGRSVCTIPSHHLSAMILADGAGGVFVAWSDDRSGTGFDIYAQHVLANGGIDPSWPTDGRAVCTAPYDQWNDVITSDGSGAAIIAWADARSGSV